MYWHVLFIWPMALVPILIAIDSKLSREGRDAERMSRYLVVLTIYFCLTNLFAGLGSKKHSLDKSFHQRYFDVCKDRCNLDREIY